MEIILTAIAALLALAAFLPLLRRDEWWIRGWDFPRGQVFILAMIALVIAIIRFEPEPIRIVTVALLAAAMFAEGVAIAPYMPFAPKEVQRATDPDPDRTFSLLVANVLMSNRRYAELVTIIRDADPDIILALEPDRGWEDGLRDLDDDYPHTLRRPLDNRYGMLLYSRLELKDASIRYLLNEEFPSMHARVLLRSGDDFMLHCLHPEPPSPTEAEDSTRRDAELLIVGREAKDHGGPTVVAGDLNDVAWSRTTRLFQKISGLLDPRRGRGLFNTYHAKHIALRWPLDHVFHSDHFRLVELKRLPAFGSDHFPVLARLAFEPGAEIEQKEPHADGGDIEEAEEKISEGEREADRPA